MNFRNDARLGWFPGGKFSGLEDNRGSPGEPGTPAFLGGRRGFLCASPWIEGAAAGGSRDTLLLFLSLSSTRGSDSAFGWCIAAGFDLL